MKIAGHPIGAEHEPFIVAEVGINHGGSVDRAIQMIRYIAAAGCDAAKFQCYKAREFCSEGEAMFNTFAECELPDDAWPVLKQACADSGIIFFASPQNPSDLDLLLRVGVPAIKIGSDDLTNIPMLRYCVRDDVNLPVILSSGMADLREVIDALDACRWKNVAMLVCTSQYPCEPQNANLGRVATLHGLFGDRIPIGFSDHTQGSQAAIIAASLGACIFEKHFTLDHALPGPEHAFAATLPELREWVDAIRSTRVMLGKGAIEPSQYERDVRDHWRRKSGQQIRGTA